MFLLHKQQASEDRLPCGDKETFQARPHDRREVVGCGEISEAKEQTNSTDTSTDRIWKELVRLVQCGDSAAMGQLYRLFYAQVRFCLSRRFAADELDDGIHDAYLIVVQAIQRGDLRDPEKLLGFIRTVVQRQVAAHIRRSMKTHAGWSGADQESIASDPRPNPEQDSADKERVRIMRRALEELSTTDREILTRFYLKEQSPQAICQELNLTETQFRLAKSRAKARLSEVGRRKLAKSCTAPDVMRESVARRR